MSDQRIQINIRLYHLNKVIPMSVNQSESFRMIKTRVQIMEGISANLQRIMIVPINRRIINEYRSLASHQITNGSTINIYLNMSDYINDRFN